MEDSNFSLTMSTNKLVTNSVKIEVIGFISW